MKTMNAPTFHAARGFTLVEVMVALIIIAIGMLGIAKMQGLALSSTNASRSRALASIEASSMASAMQANRAYWSNSGSVPGTITVTTSAGTATLASTSATMQAAISAVSPGCAGMGTNLLSCMCTTGNSAPCTTSNYINLAASDLYDWAQTLAGFLPNAQATVTCNSGDVPVDCTININWNENTVALTTQQASNSVANGSTIPVSYNLYVVP
jgi:type IV pilus assembly protein PilV